MNHLEPAFILHRKNYSNTSLLIECFTLNHGRFPVIAKGVRSNKKTTGTILQPFTPLHLQWVGRGEVKTLTKYEAAGPILKLSGKSLYCGFYLNEILTRLIGRNDPHIALFKLYVHALTQLQDNLTLENTLRYFELDLLHEIGYGLVLEHEVETNQAISAERYYYYDIGRGVLEVFAEYPGAIQGHILIALQKRQVLTPRQYSQARRLTRTILSYYLGNKPVKSRELFLSPYNKIQ